MLTQRHRFYYLIKPFVPWRVRMGLRRIVARRMRKTHQTTWPINESTQHKPTGWTGWPEGKKFAFVLTHDVEGPEGVAKCRALAELEIELGFRSSFNFIPEGSYSVPVELRDWLTENGFEVGVHDLAHNGKLFQSRREFKEMAKRINRYLREWRATGFRAGFMLRNLDWLHDLDIRYDASMFDTDPFEPLPAGASTIFPFWIPTPPAAFRSRPPFQSPSQSAAVDANARGGYVELPYTLAQDSTLFLVLREKTIAIWQKKLDWIASHGGMALVIVHPDYVNFDENNQSDRVYPIERYREFLEYIRRRYQGEYWHALPRKVAANMTLRQTTPEPPATIAVATRPSDIQPKPGPLIWIDLDNTPHVPFFIPVIRELKARGYRIHVTARDAFQVCELASKMGMEYQKIGRHYGKNPFLKVFGLLVRGIQLLPTVLRSRPIVGLSHGSRSQIFICKIFRIPTVQVMDYEFSSASPLARPLWEIVPDSLPDSGLHTSFNNNIRKYRGIKEDVYVPEFKPDPSILDRLKLRDASLVATVRPPANEAHYHNPESEVLFEHFMNRALKVEGIRIVLLPRNKRQEEQIRLKSPAWFTGGRVIVPVVAEDGVNLLWHSDLVVSGGGTMNREAAALGVPVYSIFRGKIGAVDVRLQQEGRLGLIENVQQVDTMIPLVRKKTPATPDSTPRYALHDIVEHVTTIVSQYASR